MIAICYLIAAAIYLTAGVRGQLLWILSLMAVYWLIMKLAPVPGYGAGYLDAERNFAHYIDRIVLGAHNYAATKTWDPEGLLSTLPAIATALLGGLAGTWMRSDRAPLDKVAGLFVVGSAGLVLGLVWGEWFAINKNLWTSTFAVFSAGFAMLLFGMCYWLIDARGYRRWTAPLQVYGRNAITVFSMSSLLAAASVSFTIQDAAGSEVTWHDYVYRRFFAPFLTPGTYEVRVDLQGWSLPCQLPFTRANDA